MADHQLVRYIEQALQNGADKTQIANNLQQAGWPADLVNKFLARYAGVDNLGLVVPAPRSRFHQVIRDIFVYLLTFITIGMVASGILGVLFYCIECVWPDPTFEPGRQTTWVNWLLAQLVVAFPLYTYLARWTYWDISRSPEKRDSLVRKLLIYIILIVTAIAALCDFIALLFNWLQGNLTTPFMLKAITVFGVVGLIFAYYFYEMRQDENTNTHPATEVSHVPA